MKCCYILQSHVYLLCWWLMGKKDANTTCYLNLSGSWVKTVRNKNPQRNYYQICVQMYLVSDLKPGRGWGEGADNCVFQWMSSALAISSNIWKGNTLKYTLLYSVNNCNLKKNFYHVSHYKCPFVCYETMNFQSKHFQMNIMLVLQWWLLTYIQADTL